MTIDLEWFLLLHIRLFMKRGFESSAMCAAKASVELKVCSNIGYFRTCDDRYDQHKLLQYLLICEVQLLKELFLHSKKFKMALHAHSGKSTCLTCDDRHRNSHGATFT